MRNRRLRSDGECIIHERGVVVYEEMGLKSETEQILFPLLPDVTKKTGDVG